MSKKRFYVKVKGQRGFIQVSRKEGRRLVQAYRGQSRKATLKHSNRKPRRRSILDW